MPARITTDPEDGFTVEHAIEMLRWAGYTVSRSAPGGWRGDPERYFTLQALVESGVSLSEIRRSEGFDPRTVKKWFPDYKPYEVGGGGDAAVIRETNRRLTEFLRRGKISNNRENGFRPKES